ncbi:hypothetical protein M422DRAFT_35541, partial [Sphaerobolus stellatus SS14]
MLLSQLKLTIWRTFVTENYPENPHVMHMSHDQWEKWLAEQSVVISWRSKIKYISKPKSSRQTKIEWSHRYDCSHAGAYKDRRDPDLSPGKRHNRAPSNRVQCPARVIVLKPCDSDLLRVEYFWQHENHDPATIKDMRESRNPDAVRN